MDATESFYAGWGLTMLFYAAVHAVQAYFVTQGRYPITHAHRDSSIQRDANIRAIYIDYREMENLSRVARYDTIPNTEADLNSAKECLHRIRSIIDPLLR